MNIFKLFFGGPVVTQRTVHRSSQGQNGTGNGKTATTSSDPGSTLAVSKAIGQLSFISRSYGLSLCESNTDDIKADLETMLRHGDLSHVRFELLDHENRVLFEFRLSFAVDRATGRIIDSGQGIELPILDRNLVTGKRFVVQRNGQEMAYRHLLRLNWTDAPNISKVAGAEYESEHAAKISGGRQRASFHVGNAARHQFVVTQVGTKGFGFARDLTSGRDGVFVLAKQLPSDVQFAVGTQFSALLVQTPRGLQVRSVSAA